MHLCPHTGSEEHQVITAEHERRFDTTRRTDIRIQNQIQSQDLTDRALRINRINNARRIVGALAGRNEQWPVCGIEFVQPFSCRIRVHQNSVRR